MASFLAFSLSLSLLLFFLSFFFLFQSGYLNNSNETVIESRRETTGNIINCKRKDTDKEKNADNNCQTAPKTTKLCGVEREQAAGRQWLMLAIMYAGPGGRE